MPSSKSASRCSGGAELAARRDIVERLEGLASRYETPAGDGGMVWHQWGEGPAVVLLQGGHGSWTHWILNIETLAAHHCVIVPDMPGFGDSPALPRNAIAPVAAAVADGLREVGLDGAYFLAGFSYGASVAAYLASPHTGRIRRLSLVGAAGLGPFDAVRDMRCWRDVASGEARLEAHRHNLARL